jgi:predicted DNA-binding transcriptional regulator YafY
MNRIDRLMGILTTLQSHKYITAEKIAAKFEISIRTVYRDIKSLGEIGIPISFENKKGYFIVQGYFLPPVSFTSEEANALVLIASLADRFADGATARYSLNALEKIRTVLRSSDKERSERLTSKIKVWNPNGNSNKYLPEIQDAICNNTILEIEYTDQKSQKTQREIEPIGMIYYTDQWHLIAWCWQRKDYRDFIVKQINSLKNSQKPFLKTDHISVEDYMRNWN